MCTQKKKGPWTDGNLNEYVCLFVYRLNSTLFNCLTTGWTFPINISSLGRAKDMANFTCLCIKYVRNIGRITCGHPLCPFLAHHIVFPLCTYRLQSRTLLQAILRYFVKGRNPCLVPFPHSAVDSRDHKPGLQRFLFHFEHHHTACSKQASKQDLLIAQGSKKKTKKKTKKPNQISRKTSGKPKKGS